MNKDTKKKKFERTPNNTMVYTRDENLLRLSKLKAISGKAISGFWNFCLNKKNLLEEFNTKVKK